MKMMNDKEIKSGLRRSAKLKKKVIENDAF